jgi:DNA repair exonuclease SbcCD ATPase subunit
MKPVRSQGWNLFNQPPNYNYKTMSIDTTTLENPYIQVVWEDVPENFTQERIKSVKQYFQKKYLSQNVNVITKVKNVEEGTLQTVDVSLNIMDKNYQTELLKSYLTGKGYDPYIDDVLGIDGLVENRMIAEAQETTSFKKWYIKKIEFSNFLSYGENQVLDFTKCDGITVVESDPPNFGGKTVLSVDLLLFLFFNTTTKSSKAEEIFNRFTDKDKVSVRGEITIDGEDYIIVRNLERKLKKDGEWNVKTELDFFKKLADGQLMNFTGEQRRETEKFIKTSIGEQEDFLMTILTTASNLEDLIESKPTARGQVLSKFLGLEFLKKKEETGKELFSEFSKTMMSNVYSSEELKQKNETITTSINELNLRNTEIDTQIVELAKRITKGQEYRDSLVEKKHTDIDHELAILNPENLSLEIIQLETKKTGVKLNIDQIQIVEPSKYYHEDEHDKIKEEMNDLYKQKSMVDIKVDDLEKLSQTVSGGMKCEHCGIELMNAAITQSKLNELGNLKSESQQLGSKLSDAENKEKSFVTLKKDFDIYEKNKIIKEKYEAEYETIELKIDNLKDKQSRYISVQEKITENKKTEELIIKASIKLQELIDENTKLEREKGVNINQIQTHQNNIQKNLDIIQTIQKEMERERIYKIYLEVFGKNGISKIIMKTMMPLINSELQRLLQDSSYFRLEIRISDKNEVEFWMIDNGTGIEKLMVSGSGYERTIASLALRAVLSKVCSLPKPNIIVFDEVFGKISNENLEMVGEFFVKIKEYFEKIFVITHNPLVSNWANSVVTINKVNNISKVSQ